MTMLLKLPVSKECVVLSGDKRLSDSAGITDDNVKATRLGKNGVGGATGATRRVEKNGNVQVDAHEQMRVFFDARDANPDSIKEFRVYLRDQHNLYIDTYRNGVQYEKPYRLYDFMVSSLQGGLIVDYSIYCSSTPEEGFISELKTFLCKSSVLMAAGDDDEKKALFNPFHAAFKDMYAQPDIAGILTLPNGLPFGSITVERAVEICHLATKLCSAMKGETSTISPACDVLILDKDGVRPA